MNWSDKANATSISRDAIFTTPSRSTSIRRKVNPFHYCATMHFATKIDISRLCQKT
ncbi:Uncharacterised protein [Vibrio cholerae]|nr:Uncharacterised protein [Vibrio cholerae]CSC43762.1 Uncharacterised protein [Vibrio cholerae]